MQLNSYTPQQEKLSWGTVTTPRLIVSDRLWLELYYLYLVVTISSLLWTFHAFHIICCKGWACKSLHFSTFWTVSSKPALKDDLFGSKQTPCVRADHVHSSASLYKLRYFKKKRKYCYEQGNMDTRNYKVYRKQRDGFPNLIPKHDFYAFKTVCLVKILPYTIFGHCLPFYII